MTEQISLNLTLEELEIIDKYIELNDDTRQLFDKIREAYPKSPEETAYKRVYGWYPPTTPNVSNHGDTRWTTFQNGYSCGYGDGLENDKEEELLLKKSFQEENERIKRNLETSLQELSNGDVRPIDDVVKEAKLDLLKEIENHKSPEEKAYKRWYGDYPTDPSVSNFGDNRWKSFQIGYKAAKEDLEPKPEGSLKFQLGKSLENILYDWWGDVFVNNSNLDTETSICDLVDRIELFLPKSQSAAGSQSVGAELLVEGWNNCISIIKGKLR